MEQNTQQMEKAATNGAASNGAAIEADSRAGRLKMIANDGGLKLTTMQEMIDFATIISQSGLAPRGLETPQKLFVALAMGSEVGLSPMQAVQNIGVINGRPSIYGAIALGLVRASGLLEEFDEWFEDGSGKVIDAIDRSSTDDMRAVCVSKRLDKKSKRTAFTVKMAKEAGLWGKTGPWQNSPGRMLQHRARGFNLSDNFADVLNGIATLEEQIGDEPILSDEQVQAEKKADELKTKLEAAKNKPSLPKAATKPQETKQVVEEIKTVDTTAEPTVTEESKQPESASEPAENETSNDASTESEEAPDEPAITDQQRFKIMRLAQILHPSGWEKELEKLLGQKTFNGFTVSDGEQLIKRLEDQLNADVTEAEKAESKSTSEQVTAEPTLPITDAQSDAPKVDADGVMNDETTAESNNAGITPEGERPFDDKNPF